MKTRVIKNVKETIFGEKKYTIMVYGELEDVKEVSGFYAVPVTFNGKTHKTKDINLDKSVLISGFNQHFSRTKKFNMGWAICAEPDTFDYETGVKICKRRFARSPMTTQNGRFLTSDMCQAIVDNEVEYIEKNIFSFIPQDTTGAGTIDKHVKGINKSEVDSIKKRVMDKVFGLETKPKVTTRIYPRDLVRFEMNGRTYVGIYKATIFDKSNNEMLRREMYFHAPVDNNGLVDHNKAMFFESVSPEVVLNKANIHDEKLINAYLRGAHNKEWDSQRGAFKLILD